MTEQEIKNKTEQEKATRWIAIDANDKVLGRLACDVANILLGKDRLQSSRHEVEPVRVIITNTDKVALTGKKEKQKLYRHYTGYPGGLKERSVAEQRKRDSRVIVENAIIGMLPKNKLRARRMANVYLFIDEEHPYQDKINNK